MHGFFPLELLFYASSSGNLVLSSFWQNNSEIVLAYSLKALFRYF
jgi:hypothetical protein